MCRESKHSSLDHSHCTRSPCRCLSDHRSSRYPRQDRSHTPPDGTLPLRPGTTMILSSPGPMYFLGYPSAWLHVSSCRGTPIQSLRWDTPARTGWGTPSQYPLPPIGTRSGYPHQGLKEGTPMSGTGLEYPLPIRNGWGCAPERQSSKASTRYTAGCMPLAFTKKAPYFHAGGCSCIFKK